MWPSDQRLTGGMMTYRGRGITQVKVGPLGKQQTPKKTAKRQGKENHGDDRAAAWQHGEATTLQNQKQNHGNNMAAKSFAPATAWDKTTAGYVTPHIYIYSSSGLAKKHSEQDGYGTATEQNICKSTMTSQTRVQISFFFV